MTSFCRVLVTFCWGATLVTAQPLGIFEGHTDIGTTPKAGSSEYDSATREYRVTGGGANIWSATDAFQYAWKRISGDVTLTADVRFIGAGAVPHRKAVLMVRQDLSPDSPYADAALHGVGMTSLQFRPAAGAVTQEIQAAMNAPGRIRITRRGDVFAMYLGQPGGELQASGSATVVLHDPVYVGLGVCSHNADILETAVFSNVKLETRP